jgi:hypothetical protein
MVAVQPLPHKELLVPLDAIGFGKLVRSRDRSEELVQRVPVRLDKLLPDQPQGRSRRDVRVGAPDQRLTADRIGRPMTPFGERRQHFALRVRPPCPPLEMCGRGEVVALVAVTAIRCDQVLNGVVGPP